MFLIPYFYIFYYVSYFNLVLYVNKKIFLFGYFKAIFNEVVVFPDPAQEFTDILQLFIYSIIYNYSFEIYIYSIIPIYIFFINYICPLK